MVRCIVKLSGMRDVAPVVASLSLFVAILVAMPLRFSPINDARPSIRLGSRMLLPFLGTPVRLGPTELASHIHLLGLTGQGKSKLLAHFATQLILQGRACSVLDPHADLASDVLQLLLDQGYFKRPGARQKLLFVDFASREGYVPFNVLDQPFPVDQVASQLVEACTRAWPALAEGQAPQFENILLAGATVLIHNHLPLTQLTPLLTEKAYREQLLTHCPDPQITSFFHERFDRWGKETPLMIESTLRRVFLLSYSPTLRNCLGQTRNLLNLRELMDRQVSLIINLGGLDEPTQRLLGSLLTVGFEVAALSRADIPGRERLPYHLVMDEFSMFSAQSEEALSRVLSLARKYRLFLVLAHQTFSQLSSRLAGALQNSAQIFFKLGRDDAVWAAPRLGSFEPHAVKHTVADETAEQRSHPVFYSMPEQFEAWAKALESLKPRQAYVRLGGKTVKVQVSRVPHPRSPAHLLDELRSSYAKTLLTPKEQIQDSWEPSSKVSEQKEDRTHTVVIPNGKKNDQVVLGRKELVHKAAPGGDQRGQGAGMTETKGMPRSLRAASARRRTGAVL